MNSVPSYQTVGNIKFPKRFNRKSIEFALKYEPTNSDKFVVTYPKSGTTWTQHIINLIINDGHLDQGNQVFMRKSYLEYSGEDMDSSQVIKTHLPFETIAQNKKAKYLAIFRNPKDCCVSFYYFTLKIDPEFNGNFHDFFQHWITGNVSYGDYFRHTLDYWNHRFDDNFQFLVYEEMIDNPRDAVLGIARFLGQEFVRKLEDNEHLIEEVIEKSSIDSMRNHLKVYDFFVRKGVVGDWRRHFTKEESDLVDQKVEKELGGTGLDELWAKYTKWEI